MQRLGLVIWNKKVTKRWKNILAKLNEIDICYCLFTKISKFTLEKILTSIKCKF